MKVVKYLKTECPYCGGRDHVVTHVSRRGVRTVRYHTCPCGGGPDRDGRFQSHEHLGVCTTTVR
jgi:hypothetical protein